MVFNSSCLLITHEKEFEVFLSSSKIRCYEIIDQTISCKSRHLYKHPQPNSEILYLRKSPFRECEKKCNTDHVRIER